MTFKILALFLLFFCAVGHDNFGDLIYKLNYMFFRFFFFFGVLQELVSEVQEIQITFLFNVACNRKLSLILSLNFLLYNYMSSPFLRYLYVARTLSCVIVQN